MHGVPVTFLYGAKRPLMRTEDSIGAGGSVSHSSSCDESPSTLTKIENELAHWRGLAQREDEHLRLALDLGRLGTWD